MNILFICDEYPPCSHGGIGTVTQTLAREMSNKGHKIVVAGFYPYFRKSKPTEKDGNILIYRYFYGNKIKLILSKRALIGRFINIKHDFDLYISNINSLIDEHKIDIIEMADFSEAMYYGRYTDINYAKIKKPYVIKLHGTQTYFSKVIFNTVFNEAIYKHEKRFFSDAKGIIAISNQVSIVCQQLYNINCPITKIPNGIYLPPTVYKDIGSKTVVFAGTLDEKKGVYSLEKAWRIVSKKKPEYMLHLYGKGENTFRKKLNSKLNPSIIIKGIVPYNELINIYLKAACAVFPSFAESMGMAPLEAMSVGCPTIFTKLSTGPEFIDNGKDGILIDPNNIEELADAIIFMLNNREKAIEIGLAGRNRIINNLLTSDIADSHISFFKTILAE